MDEQLEKWIAWKLSEPPKPKVDNLSAEQFIRLGIVSGDVQILSILSKAENRARKRKQE